MKKITNISLAGVAFSIEEDAYDALQAYLAAIEAHFAPLDDGEEVMADIERGIGDKLAGQLDSPQGVVSLKMVEQVIAEMGRVEDIIGADEEQAGERAHDDASGSADKGGAPKRFFRDPDGAILGGVAAGIANYFGIDPVVVRLAFVIGALINGLGILAYLVLWLIVPAAKTTSEKYQMRGETITLSHIAKQMQDNLGAVDAELKASGLAARIREVLEKLFSVIGLVIRGALKVVRVALGLALIFAGALEIAAITVIATLFMVVTGPEVSDPITTSVMAHIKSNTAGVVFTISAFIAGMVIPLVAIIAGASLLTARNRFTVRSVLALGITWIVAFSIALASFLAMLPALSNTIEEAERGYQSEARTWHTVELAGAPQDVRVEGQVSVRLVESDELSLRIRASDETYKEIQVEQNGSSLSIGRDTQFRLCFFCGVNAPYVVEIHAPDVAELSVSGAGDVLIEGSTGDTLELILSGAFDAVVEQVQVTDFVVRMSGSHELAVEGSATNASFDVSGSNDVFAESFATQHITLDASGSNTFYLQPLSELSGSLSGATDVHYIPAEGLVIDIDDSPYDANHIDPLSSTSTSPAAHASLIQKVRKAFEE